MKSGKLSAELAEYRRKRVINLQDSLAPHTNRAIRKEYFSVPIVNKHFRG
jgi:hypothetical protein